MEHSRVTPYQVVIGLLFWAGGIACLAVTLFSVPREWGALAAGIMFTAAGLLLTLERTGVSIRPAEGRLVRWFGFEVPWIVTIRIKTTTVPLSQFTAVEVRSVRGGWGVYITGSSDVPVDAFFGREAACRCARKLAVAGLKYSEPA